MIGTVFAKLRAIWSPQPAARQHAVQMVAVHHPRVRFVYLLVFPPVQTRCSIRRLPNTIYFCVDRWEAE